MRDPIIRVLTAKDLNGALALSTLIGWNQQLDDWRLLVRLAPAGAFAASIDERIVGTAIGIDYRDFGWIAMMLVDPACRGRGLGRRLLEAAIDAVPAHLPVRLDATPLGRPLYRKYGFEDEAMLGRYVAALDHLGTAPARGATHASLRQLAPSDLNLIIDQDRDAFGGQRAPVLEWALETARQYAYSVRTGDGLVHYCLGRHGRLFDQIGPVVAGDEEIAGALLSQAFAAASGRAVAVDAFESNVGFTAALRDLGFTVQRPLIRMRRAPRSQTRSAAGVRQTRLSEYAIFGPEFA
jgi:GNAT superfamily N-acetyltransferase